MATNTTNTFDRRANVRLLAAVISRVIDGYYNDHVRELLADILAIEGNDRAAAIVRQLPRRTTCGPVEGWQSAALKYFVAAEQARLADEVREQMAREVFHG